MSFDTNVEGSRAEIGNWVKIRTQWVSFSVIQATFTVGAMDRLFKELQDDRAEIIRERDALHAELATHATKIKALETSADTTANVLRAVRAAARVIEEALVAQCSLTDAVRADHDALLVLARIAANARAAVLREVMHAVLYCQPPPDRTKLEDAIAVDLRAEEKSASFLQCCWCK
ncbi:hypothetical protein B0H11DRAFT_1907349 [Mycena galericulata]|nr:hypothetical protein B0H11DRAFT_1907349 [Mycena galericulata]